MESQLLHSVWWTKQYKPGEAAGGGGNLKVITLGSERVDICAIDCYSLFYPIQSSDIKKRQEIPGNFDKLPTLPVD